MKYLLLVVIWSTGEITYTGFPEGLTRCEVYKKSVKMYGALVKSAKCIYTTEKK